MPFSPAKQILNTRLQFQREYARAVKLYQHIQQPERYSPEALREEIQNTIINNTLKNTLLQDLDRGFHSGMAQELEQYFNLASQLPVLSTSTGLDEAFAQAVKGYFKDHPRKPSWHLREIIQFGGMRAIKAKFSQLMKMYPLESAAAINNLEPEEAKELLALYDRAEALNEQIKQFIAKDSPTPQEYEAILEPLREMYRLHEKLLTFANNSRSVKSTLETYRNLLDDMEAFVAANHNAPLWKPLEERALFLRFELLVFGNQVNQFEEVIPILQKLYTITEMYPIQRMTEQETINFLQNFFKKEGFWPRSVQSRDFFDTRKDEPLLFEAMTYWKRNSPAFAQELNKLMFPEENNFPPFF